MLSQKIFNNSLNTMLVDVNEDLLNQAIDGISNIRINRLTKLNIETPDDFIKALELKNLF